jgi:hypothetical protein
LPTPWHADEAAGGRAKVLAKEARRTVAIRGPAQLPRRLAATHVGFSICLCTSAHYGCGGAV